MNNEKTMREPLFHISKKASIPLWKAILIRVAAILAGLALVGLICVIIFKQNPFAIYEEMIMGNIGTDRRIRLFLQDGSLLLLVTVGLLPAFKMKFWNLGGNGQVLMGCMATIACMQLLGGKMPKETIWIFMIVSSVLAGAIWAVIPAIFKSLFNTNESLFTLMMNYIATTIVAYFISKWATNGSGVLTPYKEYCGWLPMNESKYLLVLICAAVVTTFMFFYLKSSKHGYEVLVVGESINTAKYVGINVKKVQIRTLLLSGAICGLVGLLLGGSINHTISESSVNNMGFTAIMAAWLANCNPLMIVISAFGITFLTKGMKQVQTAFGITNNAVSDIIIGVMYFAIIACEFFISYEIKFRHKKAKAEVKEDK